MFKTKELSKQIGSARLSFASAEYMEKYLDITPGAVSIMGLMNDKDNVVRLLVDEDLLKEEWIGCHPCVNTSSIRVKTKDMFDTVMKAMHHEMTVVKLTGKRTNDKSSYFDMDGTLLDTEKYYIMFWPKALEHFGYKVTREQVLTLRSLGRPYAPEYLKKMVNDPNLDYEAVRSYRRKIMEEYLKTVKVDIKPGQLRFLLI